MGNGAGTQPIPTNYTEWPVHPALASRVVCTWIDPARPQRHTVLPDACMDLIWDGRHLLVAGPDTGPADVATAATVVGVRFRPGAAPGFLGLPASELRDRRVPLAALWGRAADELAEQLAGAAGAEATVLERILLARQSHAAPVDPLVLDAFRELDRDGAAGRAIHTLARRLGVDERTLRRRCAHALGYSPKTLERILRFRRALRLGRAGLPLTAVAATAGYADQAHLSRECRRLAGATPSALFGAPAVVVSTNG